MEKSNSPTVSPTKNESPITLRTPFVNNNNNDNYSNEEIKPSGHSIVRKKVARLSISESPESKNSIINSLISPGSELNVNNNENSIKRRRSSVALVGKLNFKNKSRQNSITSGKIIKKKKKNGANRIISLKINDKYFINNRDNTAGKKNRVSIKDIRDLVLFLLHGTNNSPQWLNIENRASLGKIVVLFMPGLEPEDYGLPQTLLFSDEATLLRDRYLNNSSKGEEVPFKSLQTVPVCAPGSRLSLFSAYNSFINVGLTKNEKVALKNELSKKKITVNDLLMPLGKLLENDYPIHPDTADLSEEYKNELNKIQLKENENDHWINTKESNSNERSHIYGLDCEMCMSEAGLVVTRVSILDFQLNTIYDKLVKPDVPIVDYLTKYSGITKEILEPVTTTLKDIQNDILKMINANDILVGHSLQSDLKVLKLRHPKIVDTAIIFDHKAGPPFKPALKYLASEYLNSNIQVDNGDGHNSIEDAKACLELLKLKILKGMAFGISVDTENLFYRLGKLASKHSLILNDSVATNNNSSHIGDNYVSSIRCNSDEEIMNNIIDNVDPYDLFVARLRDLEFSRNYSKPSILSTREIQSDSNVTLQKFTTNIKTLYDTLPIGSMILLLSGSGNTKDWSNIMGELNKSDTKENRMKKRQEMEKDIETAINKARDGVATFIIKDNQDIHQNNSK